MPTCAYKTGASSVDELIIVRQYEWTPLLDLQAVLPAGDPVAAVHLCGVEELGTDPLFVDSLHREQYRRRARRRVVSARESGYPLQRITSSVPR